MNNQFKIEAFKKYHYLASQCIIQNDLRVLDNRIRDIQKSLKNPNYQQKYSTDPIKVNDFIKNFIKNAA